eukprot:TRINITY_DN2447_c0_g1_i2.p2 TRINITY_DN2447_c0_g1~~TRINITY_DN2447_c0_g1_i2.p2  ORF type:complete len:448 (+),score=87.88 TRINITY_DN2447_c0_g1_i2:62-1405(+)
MKSIVAILCLGLLLAPAANAARVVVSAGAIQIEVIDWAVHVYVTKVNNSTGQPERVPNFKFIYEPKYVGEYWDFVNQVGKDFGPAGTGIPINITIPNDDTVFDSAYTINLANGSVSNVLERTVKLSNGANFTQVVETFTRDSWKGLYGWKVPVGPDTLKITARFTNWPINESIIPVNMTYSKYIQQRAVLLNCRTRIEMLFREDASGFFLKDPSVWPVYSYDPWYNLDELVDPATVPDDTIGQNLLTFRDRRFTLDFLIIKNSSACDANDMNCIWKELANLRVNIGNSGYSEIIDASVNVDVPFAYDLPLYMGMSIFDKPNVEWDPNVQLLFTTDSSLTPPVSSQNKAPTLAGEVVFENPSSNAAIIGGSIAAVIVVIVIAIVAYFKGRTTLKRKSLARISRAAEAARTEDEERRRATSEAPAPASPESKRWTQASRGRALTNVDNQ